MYNPVLLTNGMKYFTLLIMALTSLAMPGWFKKLRSRLPHWNAMNNSQKVALVSFISLALLLPIITLATLEGTRLTSRANMPVTPPITPTPTPVKNFGEAIRINNPWLPADNYITASNIEALNPTDELTVEVWIKPNRVDIPQMIVMKAGGSTAGNIQYMILLDSNKKDNDGQIQMYFTTKNSDGTTNSTSVFGYGIKSNEWYHVALVFNMGNFLGFINGKSLNPHTIPGAKLDINSPKALSIGAPVDTKNVYYGFNGDIDEVRVSKVARYTSDFIPQRSPFYSDANTAALYHLDDNTKDASDHRNDARLVGSVLFVPSSIPTPILTPTPTAPPQQNAIPVITTTSLPSVILNRQYTATIAGYDLDETDTLSLAVSGLPAGLRQDKCALSVVRSRAVITCTLTGRALQAGTYPVTITLTDNHGGKTSKVLSLRIVRTAENN